MNISDRVKTFFWITSTIKRCGLIPLKEINRQWISTGLSNGQEFDRNTFRHHLDSIEDIFGIVINYSGSGYSIADANAVNTQSLQEFLVSHVQNIDFCTKFHDLGSKLQTEDIPGGAQYLDDIGTALSDNRRLRIEHRKFIDDNSKSLTVEPYCIKTKDRRWYLLARNAQTAEMRTYALDRILKLELTDSRFNPSSSVDLAKYYSNCIGVYADDSTLSDVCIKVSSLQAKYLRTLPLHPTQKETEPCVFKYHVDVTPDLVNEILRMGSNATVLAPESLRSAVREEIVKMLDNY